MFDGLSFEGHRKGDGKPTKIHWVPFTMKEAKPIRTFYKALFPNGILVF